MHRWGVRFRFALALIGFALSCFVVVPAPNLLLWIVTIGVTEWGYWLALVLSAVLCCELYWGRGWRRILTSALCGIAVILCLAPVLEARRIAGDLPRDLTQACGPLGKDFSTMPQPFTFSKLLWPGQRPRIQTKLCHYQADDGTSLELEFFSDASAGNLPCVVVVHGGAWHTGNIRELRAWNFLIAALGYRVASVSYRLAPKYPWPAQKHDLQSALTYLKVNSSQLGVDPNRFVLLGRSAGAQIALATAYDSHDKSIRGCVASYPPTDMDFDYGTAANHSILDAHKVVGQFLGGTPSQLPDLYRDASPLQLASSDSPPTLMAQGTRDEIVWIENSHKLRDRLMQLRRPVYLLEMPWATHGFDANPVGPGGQLEFYAIIRFLSFVCPPDSQ